jgi:hypothetical protein
LKYNIALTKIVCGESDKLNLTSIFSKVNQDERAVKKNVSSSGSRE